jgi:hypothetical protein
MTGFDNALEAKRRVDALLDSRLPALERVGVILGHGSSVYDIFDSLLRWTGRGLPNAVRRTGHRRPRRGLPRSRRLLHRDTAGFELVSCGVTLAAAVVAEGEAEQVS